MEEATLIALIYGIVTTTIIVGGTVVVATLNVGKEGKEGKKRHGR